MAKIQIERMRASLDIIKEYFSLFMQGTRYTVVLALVSVLISVPLGAVLALLRLSKVSFFNKLARLYVEVIRGTPLLVQIYLVYFGLPVFGIRFSDFVSAVISISLNSTAYMSEIIRSGIQAVDPGQVEAGQALGLPSRTIYQKIIFPQALKNILPAIGNEFAVLIKETSIVSVLGIKDLMYASDLVRGATYTTFTPLLFVALIYFILTSVISFLMNKLEEKLDR